MCLNNPKNTSFFSAKMKIVGFFEWEQKVWNCWTIVVCVSKLLIVLKSVYGSD